MRVDLFPCCWLTADSFPCWFPRCWLIAPVELFPWASILLPLTHRRWTIYSFYQPNRRLQSSPTWAFSLHHSNSRRLVSVVSISSIRLGENLSLFLLIAAALRVFFFHWSSDSKCSKATPFLSYSGSNLLFPAAAVLVSTTWYQSPPRRSSSSK